MSSPSSTVRARSRRSAPARWCSRAASTYSGATTVNAGTLAVNGSIANSRRHRQSRRHARRQRHDRRDHDQTAARFSPGNSDRHHHGAGQPGVPVGRALSRRGQSPTARPHQRHAGGSATLAGTVQAVFASGSYVARTYTILSAAGGLGGTTFNALTTTNLPAGFTAEPELHRDRRDPRTSPPRSAGPSALGTAA